LVRNEKLTNQAGIDVMKQSILAPPCERSLCFGKETASKT